MFNEMLLTNDELLAIPALTALHPSLKTSDKYQFVDTMRINHVGMCLTKVVAACNTIEQAISKVLDVVARMQNTLLTEEQVYGLALAVSTARFGAELPKAKTFTVDNFNRIHRTEDDRYDLWTTYNRIQENLVQGGKGMGFRRLTSIDRNLEINQQLWDIATSYLPLQQAA